LRPGAAGGWNKMLINVLKRLAGVGRPTESRAELLAKTLQEAHDLGLYGDRRRAVKAYERYLELDPSNVEALNGLGACLAEIGNNERATQVFELAYSLDDTYVPAMVNYGKLLAENDRGEEGLRILRRAKVAGPEFTHVEAVYAGLCLRMGDAGAARRHQMRSWMGNFDNLRLANCHLFWTSYDDVDEALIAAEHRFWASTVLVPDISEKEGDEPPCVEPAPLPPLEKRRLRIGYWSPDFRSHSVRYFSRPVLDGHDRERVEIFLYHDFHAVDAHTDAQREKADHFEQVFNLTDGELVRLIRSHQLDVLIELAGHTSHNRASLLAHRMATVQLTGFGYPPTTGLGSVDGKVVDRFVLGDDDPRHYSEHPVALPSSFWCFDPKEPIPLHPEPPSAANGYITFGCVGNIAKISEKVARRWVDILAAVPDSRLLIRSISFVEPLAELHFRESLQDWGLPMDRVDLRHPEGGVNFFASYGQVDIILDTFPFNGGTTTCFATFMAVPVVSMAGHSLVGRMGASVLGNVGASDLVVTTLDDYVRRAIEVARDPEYLRRFKREIRARFEQAPLGNERLFARELEDACLDLVQRKLAGTLHWESRIDPLPAREITKRAYAVARRGNPDAARRIIDHCLSAYPDHGPAHLLAAQLMVWDGRESEAIDWLRERLPNFAPVEQVGGFLSLARMHLLRQNRQAAALALDGLQGLPQDDDFDCGQARLYAAACTDAAAPVETGPVGPARAVLVLIPCDDQAWFSGMQREMERVLLLPAGWTVRYERCAETDRVRAYEACASRAGWDVLLLLHKNMLVANPHFLAALGAALERADVVSFAGATRWSRLEWRHDRFECKAAAFLGGSGENKALTELQIVGYGNDAVVDGMAVLDGRLLAISRKALALGGWDENLAGSYALLEEAWTWKAGRDGARLSVHRGLGAFINDKVELDSSDRTEALMHWSSIMGFEPFGEPEEDLIALSTPTIDAADAVRIAALYFGPT
jgi:protein O-GlcNAc transferase